MSDFVSDVNGILVYIKNCSDIDLNKNNIVDNIKNNIARVVVIGDQSAGKSSLINSIFNIPENLRLDTGDGKTTKLPILIKARKDIQELSLYVCGTDKKFSNVKEFNECMRNEENLHKKLAVLEIQYCHDIDIIDLPGCTSNSINGDDNTHYQSLYMQDMINQFCIGENTMVLHCIRSDIDFSNASSVSLLNNKPISHMIRVYTQVDRLGTDIQHIIDFRKLLAGDNALTTTKSNEIEIIDKLTKDHRGEFICGTNALFQKVSTFLNIKNKEKEEIIKDDLRELRNICIRKLKEFGFSVPDKSEILYNFRSLIRQGLENLNKSEFTDFSVMYNQLLSPLEKSNLYSNCELFIPSKDTIDSKFTFGKKKINSNSNLEVIVKPYFQEFNRIIEKILIDTLENIVKCLQINLINVCNYNMIDYFKSIRSDLKKEIEKISIQCKETTTQIIKEYAFKKHSLIPAKYFNEPDIPIDFIMHCAMMLKDKDVSEHKNWIIQEWNTPQIKEKYQKDFNLQRVINIITRYLSDITALYQEDFEKEFELMKNRMIETLLKSIEKYNSKDVDDETHIIAQQRKSYQHILEMCNKIL